MHNADRSVPPSSKAKPSLHRVESSTSRAIQPPLRERSDSRSEFANRAELMEHEAERWDGMS